MEWGAQLLVLALAAGFGFVGGRLALLGHRRRRAEEDESPVEAEFRLEHLEEQTWALVNVGQGTAALVSVLPVADGLEHWPPRSGPDHVETVAAELLPTLRPGATTSLWFSRYDPGQRVIVSWTSERNVRMGPVMLDLPAPR